MTQIILDRLDRLDDDGKADRAELKASIDELCKRIKEGNRRLGKLELWRAGLEAVAKTKSWRWPAAIGLISAVFAGAAIAVITAAIQAG